MTLIQKKRMMKTIKKKKRRKTIKFSSQMTITNKKLLGELLKKRLRSTRLVKTNSEMKNLFKELKLYKKNLMRCIE